ACGGDMPALEGAPCTPPLPRRPRKGSAELGFPRVAPADEVIVNQYVIRPGPAASGASAAAAAAAGEPLECPTCGHTFSTSLAPSTSSSPVPRAAARLCSSLTTAWLRW
ncbi:hypothetical protein E2I00_003322, partial [Balaenoptera physalus]